MSEMRVVSTGATRDSVVGKIVYDKFLSVEVIKRYGEYMLKHSIQSDGVAREGDNWKKGISKEAYLSSMFRHFVRVWELRSKNEKCDEELCALLFNVMGMLHEEVK